MSSPPVETDTMKHVWTEMKITPVDVIVGDDGEPVLFANDETEIGVGCFVCDIGLTADNADTECEGEQDASSLT